jgi:SAM-dependent methyltransferase
MTRIVHRVVYADAAFAKYGDCGAYHWREIGPNLIGHNAFTAERYRRVAEAVGPLDDRRLLDYGCGDGAFLGFAARRTKGAAGALHGFDPNPDALRLAASMLAARRIAVALHASLDDVPDGSFDRVVCSEVIEHAFAPRAVIEDIARLLKPGGEAVFTTPIRLSDHPDDPNHVREWFSDEFAALFDESPLEVVQHDAIIPAAAPEVYFWRPPFLARLPVFRLLCNVLSICAGVNASSLLGVRPRLFMTQLLVARKGV